MHFGLNFPTRPNKPDPTWQTQMQRRNFTQQKFSTTSTRPDPINPTKIQPEVHLFQGKTLFLFRSPSTNFSKKFNIFNLYFEKGLNSSICEQRWEQMIFRGSLRISPFQVLGFEKVLRSQISADLILIWSAVLKIKLVKHWNHN